jgi:hypothetical protein
VVFASKVSTFPRSVANSAANSSPNFCNLLKSSFVTALLVLVAINSLTLSKQAFNPAANS